MQGDYRAMRPYLAGLASNLVFLAILLIAAGTLQYWPAWLYFAVGVTMNVGTRRVLRQDEDLAKEREKPGPGAKAWDKKLLGVGLLLSIAMLVVAGLDAGRFHLPPRLPWPWSVAGLVISTAGMALFLRSLAENRFFSAVVRIQTDRGHTVCTTGPYAYVRHPGNLGMILGTVGLPLLLLSAWSVIPALLAVVNLVVRTHLEDAALVAELPGYRDYQRVTRYRLVPFVW